MRRSLPFIACLLALAAPAGAQVCRQAPPPFLPSLFPETLQGLNREFSSAPGEGCMGMFRPAESGAGKMWAVVSVDPNTALPLGETAEALQSNYEGGGKAVILIDGWPAAVAYVTMGDEFTTLRGSLKVTVLVKNGDHGTASQEMATAFLRAILPLVPCG